MILRIAAFSFADRMSVIKAQQPFTAPSMQCERIIQPVGFFRRRRNLSNDKPHPTPTLRIHNQGKAVQIEQRIESRIALLYDRRRLSDKDNLGNIRRLG